MDTLITAIVFLPLVGFLLAGLFGSKQQPRPSEVITTALVMVAAALSWWVFVPVAFLGQPLGTQGLIKVDLLTWMKVGTLDVRWTLRVDTLTAVMLVVVNSVSALVHLYAMGYMHEDPSRPRFFAYLSLFTFAMLMLVTSDNLLQMFFGWEGVGLASYLLIGFWYQKSSANAASIKAFVVNRVGDFGFALGIFAIFVLTGSVSFDGIFAALPDVAERKFYFAGYVGHGLTIACLLLFMGAMGKSAQFLLHTWLPDAMEGPTPVSALIHAATMVTAGVFMVARLSPVFELAPTALTVVTFFGALTAFFAATVGLVQNDIKRVIAYSTCSQLGYMFVALGVGAYGVGVFHLFTHAFFKALLFLGAGSVIHAMHHEQDMRNMGGLARHIPLTYAMMTIGTLALVGFPFTAGFYSKDAIIEAAFVGTNSVAPYAFWILVVAAFMTSFYSWRLVFMTFHGAPRWTTQSSHDAHNHHHASHAPHESPWVMTLPLVLLSAGALLAGGVFAADFFGHDHSVFWRGSLVSNPKVLDAIHHVPSWVPWAPTVAMGLGFGLAVLFYLVWVGTPQRLAAEHDILYRFLLNKWYIDEIYNAVFVRPAKALGRLFWKTGDGTLIDGLGPNGIAARVLDVTKRTVSLQTGYIYHYAFAMIVGFCGLITWALMRGGWH